MTVGDSERDAAAPLVAGLACLNVDKYTGFEQGFISVCRIRCALREWQLLALAIEQGWGGSESDTKAKVDTFVQEIIDTFNRKVPDPLELEDRCCEFVFHKFSCIADDSSCPRLANLIIALYKDCVEKEDFTGLHQLLNRHPEAVQSHEIVQDLASIDEESEEAGASLPKKMFDEDGMEIVQRRGRRRNR